MPDPFTIAMALKAGAAIFTTGTNIVQANKQKKLAAEADAAATKAIADARRRAGINVFEGIALPMEATELEREAVNVQVAQMMQAGREGSQRGAGQIAGQALQAGLAGQAGVRTDLANRMYELQRLTATEESRLLDTIQGLDVMEAIGAQEAAARAEAQRQRNLEGIATGVEQMFDVAAQATPLVMGKKADRKIYKDLMNQKMLMGEDVFNTKVAEQAGIDITGKNKQQIAELVSSYILGQDATGRQNLLNMFQPTQTSVQEQAAIDPATYNPYGLPFTENPFLPPPLPPSGSTMVSPKLGYYDPITGEFIQEG